jgi:hypothetical protein
MTTLPEHPHRLLFLYAALLCFACASRPPSEAVGPPGADKAPPIAAPPVPAPPPTDAYRACTGKELGADCITILEDQATEGRCVNPPPGATEPGLVCSAPQA